MSERGYSFTPTQTALGTCYEFKGPGLSRFASGAHLQSEHEADRVARLLAAAFEAGRKAKAEEIRNVLGVHDTPWGVKVG